MNFQTLYFGLPLAAYGGMFLFALVLLQVMGGLRVVKMPITWHKWLGISILVVALFHGIIAMLYFLG
jgi:predicted ferric reductase